MMMHYRINDRISFPNQQKGTVLIVSLMLMLVMTLLSIASMSTSLVQEKMAANAQNTNQTFQAAESAVDAHITIILAGDSSNLGEAMRAASGLGTVKTVNVGMSDIASQAQISYLGEIITTSGNTLNADKSAPTLSGQRFELVGTGTMVSVQAATQIRQGIEYN